jgi:hypothetical protein
LNEVNLARQVAHPCDSEMRDIDRAEVLRFPLVVGIVAAFLGNERGLRLKGIQMQVKRKCFLGLAGEIFVPQDFCCGDCMFRGVEASVDLIGDDASG